MASFSGTYTGVMSSGIKKGRKRNAKGEKAKKSEEDKEINAYVFYGGRWLVVDAVTLEQRYTSVDGQEVKICRVLLPPLNTLNLETLEQLVRGALGPDVEFGTLTYKCDTHIKNLPFFPNSLKNDPDMVPLRRHAARDRRVELYMSPEKKYIKECNKEINAYLYYAGRWTKVTLDSLEKRWVSVDGRKVENCRLLLPPLNTLKFETLKQLILGVLPPNVKFGKLTYKLFTPNLYCPFIPTNLVNECDMVCFKKVAAGYRRVELYVSTDSGLPVR